MTELQLQGAQAAIDIITAIAPAALILVIGSKLLGLAIKFVAGRRI